MVLVDQCKGGGGRGDSGKSGMLKKGTLWPLCCVYKYGFKALLGRVLGKKKKSLSLKQLTIRAV